MGKKEGRNDGRRGASEGETKGTMGGFEVRRLRERNSEMGHGPKRMCPLRVPREGTVQRTDGIEASTRNRSGFEPERLNPTKGNP